MVKLIFLERLSVEHKKNPKLTTEPQGAWLHMCVCLCSVVHIALCLKVSYFGF